MSRGRERYTPSEFEAAVEAVLAGASHKATQGVTGVPANTLRKYVVRHGLERRSAPQRGAKGVPATVVKLALDALANGESREQAAASAGMAHLNGVGLSPKCSGIPETLTRRVRLRDFGPCAVKHLREMDGNSGL
jgi:transposase-like protein